MYSAPVEEIAFVLKHVAGLQGALDAGDLGDLSEDLVDAILEEAGRFASEEIAPLRRVGDQHGAVLSGVEVTTPPGWKDLYQRWIDGGWNALQGPEAFGGQALPTTLGIAALEMWNSGSMAFGIGPALTMGAAEALLPMPLLCRQSARRDSFAQAPGGVGSGEPGGSRRSPDDLAPSIAAATSRSTSRRSRMSLR